MKKSFIVMDPEDNCATSLEDIPIAKEIEIREGSIITINQNIPLGHKFALEDIPIGNMVKKYGQIIGIVTKKIKKGDWIHTHNIKSHYLERVANE